MARELFDTPWIKLEVIGDDDTLQPDVFGLVEAARILSEDGFEVFPYTTEDLVVADRLVEAGCRVLMPWGAPIGSARGLNNLYGLKALRAHFPDIPLVVDAGLGVPSHAAAAMELGYDAVLLNTAVAEAGDPVAMARAFALAIEAGRDGVRRPAAGAARHGGALDAGDRQGRSGTMSCVIDPLLSRSSTAPSWVARLVPVGAKLVQLRIKDHPTPSCAARCARRGDVCAQHGAELIVNDYWQIAIDEGCDWVHLGQEDLVDADLKAIRRAGLRLGVSTHDHAELEKGARRRSRLCGARTDLPDAAEADALGAAGLERIGEWKRLIGGRPLVAIGGLTLERALLCLKAGADSRRWSATSSTMPIRMAQAQGLARRDAGGAHDRPLRPADGARRGRRGRAGAARRGLGAGGRRRRARLPGAAVSCAAPASGV